MTDQATPKFLTHAERLFIAEGNSETATPSGFVGEWDQFGRTPQQPWRQFEGQSCLVVLGEPNIGKSSEFEYQHKRLKGSGATTFLTELRDWLDGDDLLELTPGLQEAFESGEDFSWFIDALDEGRFRGQEAFAAVTALLSRMNKSDKLRCLKLRISCRTAEWRSIEFERLQRLFQRDSKAFSPVCVIRLLPLTESSVRDLALEKLQTLTSVNHFLEACSRNGVLSLAAHPLLLWVMLEQFAKSGALGANRTELFETAAKHLVREVNRAYLERGPNRSDIEARWKAADVLASRMVLAGKQFVSAAEPVERDEVLSAEMLGIQGSVLRETLATGLFSRQEQDRYRFFHRSFAEYGAARRLAAVLESGRSLRSILPVFPTEKGGIPSSVRETAAWLAGMNSEFEDWLVKNDPATACLGDTKRYTDTNRLRLVHALAESFKGRTYQAEFSRFGDLAHGISEEELRKLLDSSNGQAVRILAIEMMAGSRRQELLAMMLERALDPNELQGIRVRAIDVLIAANRDAYGQRLKGGIGFDAGSDPEDEFAGAILSGLYPTHLSTAEALERLHLPRASIVGARYARFWAGGFWDHALSSDERLLALNKLAKLFDAAIQTKAGSDAQAQRALSVGARGARDLFEVFCMQVKQQIESPGLSIETLAPMLQIAELGASTYGGALPAAELEALVRGSETLRHDLLEWSITQLHSGETFRPSSSIPFFARAYGIQDFALLLQSVKDYALEPRVSVPVFRSLIRITVTEGDESQVQQLGQLEQAKLLSPELTAAADEYVSKHLKEAKEEEDYQEMLRMESDAATGELHLESHEDRLEKLKSGDVESLVEEISKVGMDFLSSSQLAKLDERLPADLNLAIREGARTVWARFSSVATLWPLRKFPHPMFMPKEALVAGTGFWVHWKIVDTALTMTPAQAELVFWMALNSSQFDILMHAAFTVEPAAASSRLVAVLGDENEKTELVREKLWKGLAISECLPLAGVDAARQFATSHLLPRSYEVRVGLYAFLLERVKQAQLRQMPELHLQAVETVVAAELSKPTLDEATERAEIATLAFIWLVNSDSIDVFGRKVFGKSHHLRRALAFTSALAGLASPEGSYQPWFSRIPIASLGRLVPFLYAKDEMLDTDGNRVAVKAYAVSARDDVLRHIAESGESQLALSWFASWKDDERFGNLRSYLAQLHSTVLRQVSDSAWKPLKAEECEAMLLTDTSIVKTPADVRLYLDDLIERKLAPAFKKDFSLAPLLWGKKGTDGVADPRLPHDEGAVQIAVYALLRTYVKLSHVVGAREPEQYDGKKPDVRLDFVDGGVVSVPIEIKWSHNDSVWSSIEDQLVNKYMLDSDVTFGVHLVAWSGLNSGPKSPTGAKPKSMREMADELRKETERVSKATGKTISSHVIDAEVALPKGQLNP